MKSNKCEKCKHYIGRTPKRNGNPVFGGKTHVHCSKGYSCDAFSYETGMNRSKKNITYSEYKEV